MPTSRAVPPSWSSIPKKGELAIICSVRIADFFQQAALQAFVFYQLASFSPDADESQISFQVGVVQGVFSAAQIFTSVAWGRVADHPKWGRKRVILAGLVGQAISCIGVAFSSSFTAAVIYRTVGGAVNATVGGARTALSEKTERKYHTRTFLLLPLAWNVANIIAPPLCGVLSDPVRYHPGWFGANSTFGGKDGVAWLKAFPYALPNVICAFVLLADALLVFLGLEETLKSRQGKSDLGLELASRGKQYFSRYILRRTGYTRLDQHDTQLEIATFDDAESSTSTSLAKIGREIPDDLESPSKPPKQLPQGPPPFSRVLTKQVILVMTAVAFMDFQLGGFTALWTIFLSTERRNPAQDPAPQLPFRFTGGVGFTPSVVGVAMSILGVVGIICQLSLYPRVNARFGTLRATQYALFLFPVAYAIAPYLSLLASSSVSQLILWIGIVFVAAMIISARTFVVPGLVLLTNNASPSPETLGTIHGLGAAVSSAFKTLGPIAAGKWYSNGLQNNVIGESWWLLALGAAMGCIPVFWVRDGK